MIDIKELRINNIIGKNDIEYIIDAVNVEKYVVMHDSCLHTHISENVDIEPIKLDKKILLNCGFIEDKNGFLNLSWTCGMDKTKTIQFELGEDYVCCTFWIGSGNDKMFIYCKYLHQLQNLYYALRHEELDVNL